jgi:uncharacterized delta-60 repeat protein
VRWLKKTNFLSVAITLVALLQYSATAQTWTLSNTGLPADKKISSIRNGSAGGIFIGGTSTNLIAGNNSIGSFVCKSTDGGASWTRVGDLVLGNGGYVVPENFGIFGSTILSGGNSVDGIFSSANDGTSWSQGSGTGTKAFNGRDYAQLNGFYFAPSPASPSGPGGVFRSSNGSSWTEVSTGLPLAFGIQRTIWDLATHSNKLFAASGTANGFGVYVSANNGDSWSLSQDIGQSFDLQEFDGKLFAGGAPSIGPSGPYMTTNGGANWIDVNNKINGFPGAAIRQFATDGTTLFALLNSGARIYRTLGNQIVWFPVADAPNILDEIAVTSTHLIGVGTNGVWRLPLADILAAPVVPYVLVNTNNFIVNAGQSVSWTSTVYSNSAVTFQWQRAIGAGAYADIPGANTPNYSLVTATNDNNVNFRLISTSAAGAVTNFAGNVTVYSSGPGGRDTAFSPLVTFTRGFNPQVFAIAVQPDGKVLAAGNFSGVSANGSNNVRSGLARLHADGTLDTAFATGTGAGSFNGIYSVAVQPDGKVLVGGDFNSFDGVIRRGLARLHSNGLLDTNFPSFVGSTSVSNIVVQPDGKILVGGNFTGILRLTPNGTNDPTFNYGGSSYINNMANVIALQPDGKIIIGGSSTGTAKRLARLNADGSFDSTFDVGTGPNGQVLTLGLQADGKVVFAGQFTAFNGVTNRFLLGRANADGSIDSSYNTSVGPNFPPASIAVHPNGQVFMGGQFTTMQGTNRPYLARMQDATVDMTFQADASVGAVNSVSLTLAGDVLVATGPRVMRLFADKNGLAVARPFDQTINAGQTLTLTANAAGTSTISYQWLKNGTNISGATSATLTIPNAQIADSGYYSVRVSNASGNKTSDASLMSVLGAPFILTQPVGAVGYELGSVTFSALGIGSAPLTLQWQANGVNINNATNATLTVTNLLFSSATNYTLVLSNASGVLTSSIAALTVLPGAGQVDPLSLLSTNATTGAGVSAIVRQSTDKLVLGGNFTTFNGLSRLYVVRLNQDGSLDNTFTSVVASTVSAMAVQPDDRVLINRNGLIQRLNTNGSVDNTFSNVSYTTGGSGGLIGPVTQADGKFLLAGAIWTINSQDLGISGKLIRFNANGTIDKILSSTIEFSGNAIALAARDDGRIFLSGVFARINGVGRTNFAVFNSDGSLDGTFIRGNGFSPSGYPNAFEFQPDGKLVAVGQFTGYAGINCNYVARLNYDGSLDTSFNVGTGPDQVPTRLAIQDNGKVVILGGFTSVARQPRSGIARLNSDGSLDNTFFVGTGPNFGGGNLFGLTLQFNGRITVMGNFSQWNGTNRNNLVQLRGDAVPLAFMRHPLTQYVDASSNVTFSVGVYTTSAETYQCRKNGTNIPSATGATLTLNNVQPADSGAYSVVVSNSATTKTSLNGTLTVLTVPVILTQEGSATASSGSTNTLKATVVGAGAMGYQWQRNGVNITGATNVTLTLTNTSLADAGIYVLVATNAYGAAESQPLALSVTYQPGRPDSSFAYGSGFNQSVSAMAVQPDGKLLVSGLFTTYKGTAVPYFIRLNTDGTVDSSFNVTPGGPINFNSAGTLQKIVPTPSGLIYVMGTFTNIAGVGRTNLARFDTNGTFDTGFIPAATQLGTVQKAGVQADGKVIIVGSFTTVGGVARNYIARLNPGGTLDTGWTAAAFNLALGTVTVQPDDKVLVGGSFTTVGGVTQRYLARLNADGTRDTGYTNVSINSDVFNIALQPDGKILAAGLFGSAGGFTHQYFNRFTTNGNIDPPFSTNGLGANQSVSDIAPAAGGKVLIRGAFTSVNGVARPGLARINNDGSVDTSYDPGTGAIFAGNPNNSVVNSMVALPDGRVALNGTLNFTNFSGTTIGSFVVLANDGANPLTVTAQSQSDTVSPGTAVNFAVAATGIGPLTYQWYAGAAGNTASPVAGATNNTLSVVVGASVFNYWARVTNGARQTSDSLNVTVGPETLLFTRQSDGFQLNWSGNYILQMNTNLTLLNWTDVPGVSPINVRYDNATNQLFFRLRQGP